MAGFAAQLGPTAGAAALTGPAQPRPAPRSARAAPPPNTAGAALMTPSPQRKLQRARHTLTGIPGSPRRSCDRVHRATLRLRARCAARPPAPAPAPAPAPWLVLQPLAIASTHVSTQLGYRARRAAMVSARRAPRCARAVCGHWAPPRAFLAGPARSFVPWPAACVLAGCYESS